MAIFATTWGSETLEPIVLKFVMIDYVGHPTPHAKTGSRQFTGVRWGRGEIVTSVARTVAR